MEKTPEMLGAFIYDYLSALIEGKLENFRKETRTYIEATLSTIQSFRLEVKDEEAREKLRSLENFLQALGEHFESSMRSIDEWREKVRKDFDFLASNTTKIFEELTSTYERIDNRQEDFSRKVNSEFNAVYKNLQDAKTLLEEAASSIKEIRQEVASLKEVSERGQAGLQELSARLGSLETLSAKLQGIVEEMARVQSSLQERLTVVESQVQAITEEKDLLRSKVSTLEELLYREEERGQRLEEVVKGFESRLYLLEEQLRKEQELRKVIETQLGQMSSQLAKLQEDFQESVKTLESRRRGITVRIEGMNKVIGELRSDLNRVMEILLQERGRANAISYNEPQ